MDKEDLYRIDCGVGQKVKESRLLKGISQEKFAEALGITFQQIQKYEKGKNRVAASRLFHIARILEQPVSYFFGEPQEHWPKNPDKDFSAWLALYDQMPKNIRKNYMEMGKNLIRQIGKNQS